MRRLSRNSIVCIFGVVWLSFSYESRADEADEQADLIHSAAKLIKPAELRYPEAAEAQNLHGDVTVIVDVDLNGRVSDVEVTDGPLVFHEAAIEAALQLEFLPARVRGEAAVSRVRVFFHFAPPTDVSAHEPIEVIVHAADPDMEAMHSRTTLDETRLEKSSGDDLAETLNQVAGVSVSRGTGDTSKPIIRGQSERRLLVLYDGIRHEGQKWGPDHATEVDPFSAGSIGVIRGAAGALYGPDAMGGVVLVDPPPMRDEEGFGGKVVSAFHSNGLRPYGAVRMDGVFASLPRLSFRAEGNYTRGSSLQSPNYVLGNTGLEQWNAGGSVEYRWSVGSLRASYHHHDLRAGVFYGVQNSNPEEFRSQLELERPVTADLWAVTYEIDRPYQDVRHDIALLKGETYGSWGRFKGSYAYQHNVRREFDQVRESVEGPQYDFTLRTHSLEARYEQPERHTGVAHLEGGVGLQGVFQENVYEGLPLLPNYRSFDLGLFALERLAFERLDIEVGGRFDNRSQAAYLGRNDFERHGRRGTLSEERCDYSNEVARCPDGWQGISVSSGALVHVVPDSMDLKLDFSTAIRFPDLDEQYLIGSAPSFPVYGLGHPDLDPERTLGGSVTLGVLRPWLALEVSAYGYRIKNYVYFAPVVNPDGTAQIDVTARGSFPTYEYRPIEASVWGSDGRFALGEESVVGLELLGALVRQRDVQNGVHLTMTPPDRLMASILARPPGFGVLRDLELGVNSQWVAKQTRTDPNADFAAPPEGYALLGAQASARIRLKERAFRIGLQGQNLLNTVYRDYTSLLRYYADQPGLDLQIRLATDL